MIVDLEVTETTIPALLEQVANGDEVRLLRNGQAVATIVPHRSREVIEKAQAALERATERSKRLGLRFDFEEFKADKEFGRR